jgi:hypothetical protein
MNKIKKIAGLIWMALGPLSVYYLVKTAVAEIAKKPLMDTKIQWVAFVVIMLPIAVGLVLFGYYAWIGEYEDQASAS